MADKWSDYKYDDRRDMKNKLYWATDPSSKMKRKSHLWSDYRNGLSISYCTQVTGTNNLEVGLNDIKCKVCLNKPYTQRVRNG